MNTDEYMTYLEACEALGVSYRKIRHLVQTGKLTQITDPLDARLKLVPRREIEDLKSNRPRRAAI